MTRQSDLVQRIRDELLDRHPREASMFGGVSFMVDDRMVVAARRDGELLLRADPAERESLLAEPGARPALMGADRPMGAGWISVDSDALAGERLSVWLRRALDFHDVQAG